MFLCHFLNQIVKLHKSKRIPYLLTVFANSVFVLLQPFSFRSFENSCKFCSDSTNALDFEKLGVKIHNYALLLNFPAQILFCLTFAFILWNKPRYPRKAENSGNILKKFQYADYVECKNAISVFLFVLYLFCFFHIENWFPWNSHLQGIFSNSFKIAVI